MPIYEYQCRDCGTSYEELVQLSEKRNPTCPQCSSRNTTRKMSGFSVSTGSAVSQSSDSCPGCCGPGACGI